MGYQNLIKEINQGIIKPVYLFTGKELYIAAMMEKMMVEKVLPRELIALNYTVFDDKIADIADVLSLCETLPMMSDKRIVVLREGASFLGTSKKGGITTAMTETFADYLKNPSPSTVLILYESGPDKRKKLYKQLKTTAEIVEYNKLTKIELEKWLGRRLKQAGKKSSTRAIETFIDKSNYLESDEKTMEMIDNEVNKIIDYAGDRPQITIDDVEIVTPRSVEDNVFNMVDYAVTGRKDEALIMLRNFYLEGESPFGIFALLTRQLRLMLQVKLYTEQRKPADYIVGQTGIKPFLVKKMTRIGSKRSSESLTRKMIEAADLDYKMKTGGIDPEFGVEWMVLKL